jgi:hypothetical protein
VETSYSYLGLDTIVKESSTEPQIRLDYTSANDGYAGLNQFNQVVDQIWENYDTDSTLDEYYSNGPVTCRYFLPNQQ